MNRVDKIIWLIGCKGMLRTEIARQLTENKIEFTGTDIDVDITNLANQIHAKMIHISTDYVFNDENRKVVKTGCSSNLLDSLYFTS